MDATLNEDELQYVADPRLSKDQKISLYANIIDMIDLRLAGKIDKDTARNYKIGTREIEKIQTYELKELRKMYVGLLQDLRKPKTIQAVFV